MIGSTLIGDRRLILRPLLGENLNDAPHCCGPVQRALRTADDLDTIDIVHRHVLKLSGSERIAVNAHTVEKDERVIAAYLGGEVSLNLKGN